MAEVICSMVPDCHQLAFADAVKHSSAEMIKSFLEKHDISHPLHEATYPIDPELKSLLRPLWQWLGTDLVRETIDKDFWVKRLDERMEEIISLNKKIDFLYFAKRTEPSFIISDCRFANERDWAISKNFHVVRIIGRKPRAGTNLNHASETEHIDLNSDLTYSNVGTIDDMVGWVLEHILPLRKE